MTIRRNGVSGDDGDVVRIGVLGCGRIGSLHAGLLARRVPGAALATVFDTDPSAAARVAAGLGVPAARSLDEVLASPNVDAVAVCTSTDTHVDLVTAAASAGKAILCEKPISLDLAAIDRALAVVAAADVPLQVGFNRRFDPAHRSVRDAVADGRLGALHLLRITSRDPAPPPLAYVKVSGGLFLDMTIHDFDMARFVTGSEVVDVYAQGAVRITPEIAALGDIDTAVVTLRHANGCITTIDNSRRAVYGYDQRVEAFGAGGMAASENPPAHAGLLRTAAGTQSAPLQHFFLERYAESYARQWVAFVDAVRHGTVPEVTGADGRAPLLIGLAAWRSLHEHRPVSLVEIEVRAA